MSVLHMFYRCIGVFLTASRLFVVVKNTISIAQQECEHTNLGNARKKLSMKHFKTRPGHRSNAVEDFPEKRFFHGAMRKSYRHISK